MNIYVAGKWSRRPEAKALMEKLEAAGHSITHDWTAEDVQNPSPEYLRDCGQKDVSGVMSADAFVLIHDPACRGAYVELGLALANRRWEDSWSMEPMRVLVVGGEGKNPATECPIFYLLPEVEHVADGEAVVAALSTRCR